MQKENQKTCGIEREQKKKTTFRKSCNQQPLQRSIATPLSCFADATDGMCVSLYAQDAKTSNNVQLGGTTLLLCYPVVKSICFDSGHGDCRRAPPRRSLWDGCVPFPPFSLQACLFALSRCTLFLSAMVIFFGSDEHWCRHRTTARTEPKSKAKPERPTGYRSLHRCL